MPQLKQTQALDRQVKIHLRAAVAVIHHFWLLGHRQRASSHEPIMLLLRDIVRLWRPHLQPCRISIAMPLVNPPVRQIDRSRPRQIAQLQIHIYVLEVNVIVMMMPLRNTQRARAVIQIRHLNTNPKSCLHVHSCSHSNPRTGVCHRASCQSLRLLG